jgi:hypothetical protein
MVTKFNGRFWISFNKGKEMKIWIDVCSKKDAPSFDNGFVAVGIFMGKKCADEIEEDLHDDVNKIDGVGILEIWHEVCKDIFGSWLIRSRNIETDCYFLLYSLSRFEIISNLQINHFHFTVDMANLEIERIDSLIAEKNKEKYGEQLEADV